MAHVTLHFAVGIAAGTLLAAPRVARAWRERAGLAAATGRLLAAAYALGAWAALPSLLFHAGLPPQWRDALWTNVFIGYGLIERLKPGGMIYGGAGLVAAFCLHYAILIACLARCACPRRNATMPA